MPISGSYNFFDRKLLLRVTTLDNIVYELDQTFKITYEVKKVLRAEPDPGVVEIYNAGPELIKALAKPFEWRKKPGAKVEIFTGYKQEGIVTQIYSGEIQEGITRYQPPESITRLRCGVDYDRFLNHLQGGIFKKGTDPIDAIKNLLSPSGRKVSIAAGLADKIRKLFDKDLSFWDNLKNIFNSLSKQFDLSITSLGQDAPIQITELGHPNDDPVIFLSENNGLIDSPQVTHVGVNIKTLQQPLIRPGTLLQVEARNTKNYGENFTSQTVTHSGDTYGTANYTTIEALFFPPRFKPSE